MQTNTNESINLKINGALLAVGKRPSLNELDAPLRGVALSDSPVLLRAAREADRAHVTGRLHALSRRRDLPLHICKNVADARSLIKNGSRGTWALYDVASWSYEEQLALARLLAAFDQHRLHGHMSADRIPRVLVIEGERGSEGLCPQLAQRLAFFEIAVA